MKSEFLHHLKYCKFSSKSTKYGMYSSLNLLAIFRIILENQFSYYYTDVYRVSFFNTQTYRARTVSPPTFRM